MNTNQQVASQSIAATNHLTLESITAARIADLYGVRELQTFKRDEKPFVSSYAHPCSKQELGEFQCSLNKHVATVNGIKQFATLFLYDFGIVVWTSDKRWITVMDGDAEFDSKIAAAVR